MGRPPCNVPIVTIQPHLAVNGGSVEDIEGTDPRGVKMSKLSARARAMAAAGLAAAALGGGLITAPTAAATPTGCSVVTKTMQPGNYQYVSAICTGGTGEYAAWAYCKPPATWYPWITYVQSGWRRVGSGLAAEAWCPSGFTVQTKGVAVRG